MSSAFYGFPSSSCFLVEFGRMLGQHGFKMTFTILRSIIKSMIKHVRFLLAMVIANFQTKISTCLEQFGWRFQQNNANLLHSILICFNINIENVVENGSKLNLNVSYK